MGPNTSKRERKERAILQLSDTSRILLHLSFFPTRSNDEHGTEDADVEVGPARGLVVPHRGRPGLQGRRDHDHRDEPELQVRD